MLPPEAYLCADVRPSLRPMKITAVHGFQPTGNKNEPSKTTDSETPLESENSLGQQAVALTWGQYFPTEPVLLDGEMRTLELR